ncbi:MAG TPA: hypothetical protein VH206_05780 [Xanthobacteraceae bacterium]|jgi:hypothetical protein|nr:hypothetical protein [Xanthobacteraceae bacterium]
MSVTLVTIAALLLLLPGVGFIVGVNLADKNVREVVFRNTPAEIGYVVVISLAVHLFFVLFFASFNAAEVFHDYYALTFNYPATANKPPEPPTLEAVRTAFKWALVYFFVAAIVGFIPGYALGWGVRRYRLTFFAKHRWMLDLLGTRRGDVVYARVLLAPNFVPDGADGAHAIALEGILFDSYFSAEGKLLYLVFRKCVEEKIPLRSPPYVSKFENVLKLDLTETQDRFIVEGQSIAMAHYLRVPGKKIREDESIEKILQQVREDERNAESSDQS